MKITRRQLRQIIREAIDTQLSRARSKGSLPDARPDEKRAARRAERRHGRRVSRDWRIDHEDPHTDEDQYVGGDLDEAENDPDSTVQVKIGLSSDGKAVPGIGSSWHGSSSTEGDI